MEQYEESETNGKRNEWWDVRSLRQIQKRWRNEKYIKEQNIKKNRENISENGKKVPKNRNFQNK